MRMTKIKAFFDAVGAFFSWCWKYPLTPIENFQDAITRYKLSIDPEIKEIFEHFVETIEDNKKD